MEKFNSHNNKQETSRYLPEGYKASDLKEMNTATLKDICEKQNLDFTTVVNLLNKTETLPDGVPKSIPLAEKKLHPDYEFINYIRDLAKENTVDFDKRLNARLDNLPRDFDSIDKTEAEALKLLDELDAVDSYKKRDELSYTIVSLFKQHYLQKSLKYYDDFRKNDNVLSLSDEVARRSTFNKLIKEYKAGDNIYQRRNAIREVLSYFGADIGSAREVLNELNTMLDNYDKGIASDEEKDSLNKLMRAVKKVYYQGGHSAEAGIYTVLVPSLAAEYKKKFDPNRLGVATLQGGAIYDVGEYFGNSYVKNPRPRRYGDDLSHGG